MTMTIYEATFPFVVGCITILAPDDDAAVVVFEAWFLPFALILSRPTPLMLSLSKHLGATAFGSASS